VRRTALESFRLLERREISTGVTKISAVVACSDKLLLFGAASQD
jgi:hypothetical protein